MRRIGRGSLILALSSLFLIFLSPISQALTVSAAGDSAGLCTQTVSNVSGITVTKVGSDCVVQFTTESTITWTPQYTISARYLVVGSGGSGTRGYCSYYWGQGGGGGEVLTGTGYTFAANSPVTVTVAAASGRGGDCTAGGGKNGNSSFLGSLTARGGKASLNTTTSNAGAVGGVSGNGNAGGIGAANGAYGCAVGNGSCQVGGGGGAGAAGSGKNGGAGINSDIVTLGTNVMYGSGGAGWAGSGDVGTASSGGATPGSGCEAAVNRGGGGADCNGYLTTGGSGGSGFVVVRYSYNNPPIIGSLSGGASGSYSSDENITSLFSLNATDSDAGAVLAYSLTGTDASDFSINAGGALSFSFPPDFEAPSDSDLNNIYIVVVWVSDGIYSDSQTVTISVTNANESGSVGMPTLSATPYKGIGVNLSVSINAAGRVRFFVGNKRIPNCLAVSTVGSGSTFTATCSWKPASTGMQNLSATFTPTSGTFTSGTSPTLSVRVFKRTTTR
jgi:hypothetical protein